MQRLEYASLIFRMRSHEVNKESFYACFISGRSFVFIIIGRMYSPILQIVNSQYVFFPKNLSSSTCAATSSCLSLRLYEREFRFLSITVHVILFPPQQCHTFYVMFYIFK